MQVRRQNFIARYAVKKVEQEKLRAVERVTEIFQGQRNDGSALSARRAWLVTACIVEI